MFSIWKGFLPFPPLTIRARRQSFGEPGTVNITRVGKDSSYIYRQAKAILSRDETLLRCWLWQLLLSWCYFWQERQEREILYLFLQTLESDRFLSVDVVRNLREHDLALPRTCMLTIASLLPLSNFFVSWLECFSRSFLEFSTAAWMLKVRK